MAWLISQALYASYRYSQAPGEEFLAALCLAGGQSAPWKSSPTPQAFWSPARMTDPCPLFPFGMTFARLRPDHGAALLTWFRAGFPARIYQRQDAAPGSRANGPDSGGKCFGSFAAFDRVSSSWKIHPFSPAGVCLLSSGSWPRFGLMLRGECTARATPERHISATAFGSLLPTLTASTGGPEPEGKTGRKLVTLLPTLIATDAAKGGPGARGSKGDLKLPAAVALMPTLLVRDWRSGKPCQASNSRPLPEAIGGQLNPTWCEWFMGFPIGWTELKPLETHKFQAWRRSHGLN